MQINARDKTRKGGYRYASKQLYDPVWKDNP